MTGKLSDNEAIKRYLDAIRTHCDEAMLFGDMGNTFLRDIAIKKIDYAYENLHILLEKEAS